MDDECVAIGVLFTVGCLLWMADKLPFKVTNRFEYCEVKDENE